MSAIVLLIRFFVGAVFIYSGWEKLMVPVQDFMAAIDGYQFIPQNFVQPVAFVFPWLELIFGTFLFLGFLTRLSAGAISLFLISFMGLLAQILCLHLPIPEWGCFGSGISLFPKQAMILDTGLFLLTCILLKYSSRHFSLDQKLGGLP